MFNSAGLRRYLYRKMRIVLLVLLYRVPFTRQWAYRRMPRHISDYTHYWGVHGKSVDELKEGQRTLPRKYLGPSLVYLRRRLDAYGAETVLDIGCGFGRQMESLTPYYRLSGIDVVESYVQEAKARGLDVSLIDLVTVGDMWVKDHQKTWDISYAMLVFSFFLDKPEQMRRAMEVAEVITKDKVLVWDWPHVNDYMRRVYPSEKFEYHTLPLVP